MTACMGWCSPQIINSPSTTITLRIDNINVIPTDLHVGMQKHSFLLTTRILYTMVFLNISPRGDQKLQPSHQLYLFNDIIALFRIKIYILLNFLSLVAEYNYCIKATLKVQVLSHTFFCKIEIKIRGAVYLRNHLSLEISKA